MLLLQHHRPHYVVQYNIPLLFECDRVPVVTGFHVRESNEENDDLVRVHFTSVGTELENNKPSFDTDWLHALSPSGDREQIMGY